LDGAGHHASGFRKGQHHIDPPIQSGLPSSAGTMFRSTRSDVLIRPGISTARGSSAQMLAPLRGDPHRQCSGVRSGRMTICTRFVRLLRTGGSVLSPVEAPEFVRRETGIECSLFYVGNILQR
jgi:hypothetical protein